MPTLTEAALQYGMNVDKPFFPVNSIRLLYYVICDHYTSGNAEVRDQVGSLIPKVEAVFAARTQHRANTPAATAQTDWMAIQKPLQDVYQVIDTPKVHQVFSEYFSYTLPLQDDTFLELYSIIYGDQKMSVQTLHMLLRVRSMDSIIFSTLIGEILTKKLGRGDDFVTTALNFQIQLAYQLNDLVDAIVFAKDDLDAKSFSPFEMIRKIAPEPQAAKELIKGSLDLLKGKANEFTLTPALQEKVVEFYERLAGVVT